MAKIIINENIPNKTMIEEAEENWKKVFDAGGNHLTPLRLLEEKIL